MEARILTAVRLCYTPRMPRKTATPDDELTLTDAPPAPRASASSSLPSSASSERVEAQLDVLISHLARMDRRDRLRTFGGFIRGLLGLIPLILLLLSTWYFYKHSAEIMQQVTEQSAKAAAKYTQSGSEALMRKFIGR
jgi:hypothetical protein